MIWERLRVRLRRFLPHSVAVLILTAPLPVSVQVAPKLHVTLADPLVWLLGLAALWAVGWGTAWRFFRPFLLFGGLFTGWTLLSGLNSDAPFRSAAEGVQAAEYFLVAAPLFAWALSETASRRTLTVAVLLAVLGTLGWGLWHYALRELPPFEVRGPFPNRTVFGGYMAMGLAAVAAFAFEPFPFWWRGVAVLLFLIGLCSLLSGGALLALAVATGVLAFAKGRGTYVVWAFLMLVWGLGIAPLLPRPNLELARESVAVFDGEGDPVRRYAEWQAAVEMAADHPVLGVGAGMYQRRIGEYYGVLPIEGGRPAEPDSQNLYLVMAGSIGLPGLLAFLGLLGAALAAGLTSGRSGEGGWTRALRLGGVGIVAAFMVAGVWSPMLVRGVGLLLAFGLAAAMEGGGTFPCARKGKEPL